MEDVTAGISKCRDKCRYNKIRPMLGCGSGSRQSDRQKPTPEAARTNAWASQKTKTNQECPQAGLSSVTRVTWVTRVARVTWVTWVTMVTWVKKGDLSD